MSAFKIFSRFAELLDIKTTRAASVWLRLNADGTVTERNSAESLADLGVIPATDNRYFITRTNYHTRSQSVANNAAFTGSTTLETVPHITLGFLPRVIVFRSVLETTTEPLAYAPANFDFVLYHLALNTGNLSTAAPLIVPASSVIKTPAANHYIVTATLAAAEIETAYASMVQNYGFLDLWGWRLRNQTGGTLVSSAANAGVTAIEVYR